MRLSYVGYGMSESWYRLPDGTLVRQVHRSVYCGGVAPSYQVQLVAVPRAARIIQVSCHSGRQRCGPGPLPP